MSKPLSLCVPYLKEEMRKANWRLPFLSQERIEEFLDKEERLVELLNEAGLAATAHSLEESDVNKSRMSTTEARVLYRKGFLKKDTKRPTEP